MVHYRLGGAGSAKQGLLQIAWGCLCDKAQGVGTNNSQGIPNTENTKVTRLYKTKAPLNLTRSCCQTLNALTRFTSKHRDRGRPRTVDTSEKPHKRTHLMEAMKHRGPRPTAIVSSKFINSTNKNSFFVCHLSVSNTSCIRECLWVLYQQPPNRKVAIMYSIHSMGSQHVALYKPHRPGASQLPLGWGLVAQTHARTFTSL